MVSDATTPPEERAAPDEQANMAPDGHAAPDELAAWTFDSLATGNLGIHPDLVYRVLACA